MSITNSRAITKTEKKSLTDILIKERSQNHIKCPTTKDRERLEDKNKNKNQGL